VAACSDVSQRLPACRNFPTVRVPPPEKDGQYASITSRVKARLDPPRTAHGENTANSPTGRRVSASAHAERRHHLFTATARGRESISVAPTAPISECDRLDGAQRALEMTQGSRSTAATARPTSYASVNVHTSRAGRRWRTCTTRSCRWCGLPGQQDHKDRVMQAAGWQAHASARIFNLKAPPTLVRETHAAGPWLDLDAASIRGI